MNTPLASLHDALESRLPDATTFLRELIAIPSLSGAEANAVDHTANAFSAFAAVERVPLHDALRDDPDYSDPIPDIAYNGRDNLRICRRGHGAGRSLLLNTHLDTVPPADGHENPYNPVLRDGAVIGRGACDAKGQAATIFLAMAALHDLDVALNGNLVAHLVVEEENGGNGTLAMARTAERADACVVLEPTELKVLRSIRGAVWFRITLRGKAGHSGTAGRTRSALHKAVRVMEILQGYHARLRESSRGIELFDAFDNPMPLTIGRLHSGNWPATAPSEAVLEGVLGFLPNRTASDVMREMTEAIRDEGGPDIADHFDIHFTYRHDASVCAADNALLRSMTSVLHDAGQTVCVDAMPASCDAWFYNNLLDIPTVVFGGGSLGVAHSSHEHMPIKDLVQAADVLARLAIHWCGNATERGPDAQGRNQR